MKLWSQSKGAYQTGIHRESKELDEPNLLVWHSPEEEHSRRRGRWLFHSYKIKKGRRYELYHSSQLLLLKLITCLRLALEILNPKEQKTIHNRTCFPSTRKMLMKSITLLWCSQTIFKALSHFLKNLLKLGYYSEHPWQSRWALVSVLLWHLFFHRSLPTQSTPFQKSSHRQWEAMTYGVKYAAW